MKKTVTWIVVADHQHAHLFANEGPGRGISPIESLDTDGPIERSRDLMSDGVGRGFSGANGRRHGMTSRTDPHAREGERFIARLADRITQASAHDAFQRLVVVAPPRALGEIRDLLPTPVRAKVIGEINHDLTKSTSQAILEHLESYLAA